MMFGVRNQHLVSQHIEVALVCKDMPGLDEALACLAREGVPEDVAAIVEAALKIERRFGTDHALAPMRQERVPDAVAARVTAPGPRQVRARTHADAAAGP